VQHVRDDERKPFPEIKPARGYFPGDTRNSSNNANSVTAHVTVYGNNTSPVPGGPDVREIDDPREPRRYQLRDDRKKVAFTGICLASISSKRTGVQRWTQVSIFRTEAGRYIVERIGVSVVAHRIDCDNVANKKPYGIDALMPDEAPVSERQPCNICKPDIKELLRTDPASLTFEQDKHRTQIWERADDMVGSLYTQRTSPGQRALSGLMLWVLDEASKVDPIISEVYNRVEEIG
jgi:hypothetical protein